MVPDMTLVHIRNTEGQSYMSPNLVEQLRARLIDLFVPCGLSKEASETAVSRLGDWVDSRHPQGLFVDALDSDDWLGWLEHRCDVFEAVNVAVVLREISRVATEGATQCDSVFAALVKDLRMPSAYGDVIERLVALPGADTSWLPATADEAVVLDVERSWFGGPSSRYRRHVAAIRAMAPSLSDERWLGQRLHNLTRIFDSGLIFFLPETRCALEGRAFLNVSLEIADIRSGPRT